MRELRQDRDALPRRGDEIDTRATIEDHLAMHSATLEHFRADCIDAVARLAAIIDEAIRRGHKILVFGNGGSAAQAQHLAAELIVRFQRNRRAVAAIALSTDTSVLTAAANDFGFDRIFVRQCEALAQPGDVVIGISTSGRSPNVLAALAWSKAHGCRTIAMTGTCGMAIADCADDFLAVPSDDVAVIQELHLLCVHAVCRVIEQTLEDLPKPVLFVDRDGTLMRDTDYPSQPEDVELLPGVPEGLRAFASDGFLIVVVTNQSGIARGYLSTADAERVNSQLVAKLRAARIEVDSILMCPHAPEDGCSCRKPGTALFEKWMMHRNVDSARSWMVGDRASDIDAGRALGLRTAYVAGRERHGDAAAHADVVVERLDELHRVVRSLAEVRSA
jgi:D-sedoheptulose 7-phosphate isomerase